MKSKLQTHSFWTTIFTLGLLSATVLAVHSHTVILNPSNGRFNYNPVVPGDCLLPNTIPCLGTDGGPDGGNCNNPATPLWTLAFGTTVVYDSPNCPLRPCGDGHRMTEMGATGDLGAYIYSILPGSNESIWVSTPDKLGCFIVSDVVSGVSTTCVPGSAASLCQNFTNSPSSFGFFIQSCEGGSSPEDYCVACARVWETMDGGYVPSDAGPM